MTTVYLVWFTPQEYDESDALDSIWSTREKAQSRLDEMDVRAAEYIKKTGYFKNKICSESGWEIEEHQIDPPGAVPSCEISWWEKGYEKQ